MFCSILLSTCNCRISISVCDTDLIWAPSSCTRVPNWNTSASLEKPERLKSFCPIWLVYWNSYLVLCSHLINFLLSAIILSILFVWSMNFFLPEPFALEIKLVQSTKGKDMAQIDGHLYYVYNKHRDGVTTYYRCIHYRRGCRARAVGRGLVCKSINKKIHNHHFTDNDRADRYKWVDGMKKIRIE